MLFKNKFPRLVLAAAAALTLCGAGSAFEPVSLTTRENAGVEELQGQFFVRADRRVAWAVLTDYDHISQFVSSVKISRVEKRKRDDLLLVQEMEGGILFFTKRVHLLLKIHETPMGTIAFEDQDHRDFSVYQGSWNIEACPQGGVSVLYQLTVCKNFDLPLAGDAMNGGVKDLLGDVQKEMSYRQGLTGQEQGWGAASGFMMEPPTPAVQASR
jgi:hypothetical protein